MDRPKCRRCGGPLDVWHDEDDGRAVWICNNPCPLRTDEEHQRMMESLSGDEIAQLEKWIDAYQETG